MLVTFRVASYPLKCKEKKAMKLPNQPVVFVRIDSMSYAVDIHGLRAIRSAN
nr:hypothetical protein [Escherichia coli]